MKTLIVSQPRTATHLVRTTLEQHPAFGPKSLGSELFHPVKEVRRNCWKASGLPFPENVTDPAALLRIVFQKWQGFNLHTHHREKCVLQRPADRGRRNPNLGRFICDVLAEMADEIPLRVVYLYRRSLLAQYVSDRQAVAQQIWRVKKPKQVKKFQQQAKPVKVERLAFRRFCEDRKREYGLARECLDQFPHVVTAYEDWDSDFKGSAAALFDWLGVQPVSPTPRLLKQGKPSLGDWVVNLDEALAWEEKFGGWDELFG